MLTGALAATRTRKPLTTTQERRGISACRPEAEAVRGTIGRQIAAPKQNALNSTRMVPTVRRPHSEIAPSRSSFGAYAAASAARPVWTQAA
jgi:hypothetical protein